MPRFRNEVQYDIMDATRPETRTLEDAIELHQRRKTKQVLQQPTPNSTPSPETVLTYLPSDRPHSHFADGSAFSQKPIAHPPSPNSPATKRSHNSRRVEGQRAPRPKNAFILFRSDAIARGLIKTSQQNEISRIAGSLWREADEATKKHFNALAAEEKKQHAVLYPDYKYSPGTKKVNSSSTSSGTKSLSMPVRARAPLKLASTRRRFEDDDEAEWTSARQSFSTRQMVKRIRMTMPTPEPSSPEPETEPELKPAVHEPMDIFDGGDAVIPDFQATYEEYFDVDDRAYFAIAENTLFGNVFESHRKLASTNEILRRDTSGPSFAPVEVPMSLPTFFPQHPPSLATTAFASYRPTFTFEDRSHMLESSQMQTTIPEQEPKGLPPLSPFSIHISDEELFKDTSLSNAFSDCALAQVESCATSVRAISPLWMIDADEIAKEMQDFSFLF